MYIGTTPPNFQEIDRTIEEILEGISPDFLRLLKRNFERNISNFIQGSFKLELKLVCDSSSAISSLISFARKGKSLLHRLIKEPFLRLYAPETLKIEVEKGIIEIAKKHNLDKKTLQHTWRRDILPRIRILKPTDFKALFKGFLAVGMRDVTDVPFVALNLQLGAHGVITYDKDIIEQPVVKTWRMGRVGGLITVFKKGAFSFFIYSKVLPNILLGLFKIGVAILRTILEILARIAQFFANLVGGTIRAVSRLPDWAQLLIGIAIAILILQEKTRKIATDFLKELGEAIFGFASQVYSALKDLLEALAPLVQISIAVLAYLFDSYQETINQLQAL